MIQEIIDYHKSRMRLANIDGRSDDYKFHKAAIEFLETRFTSQSLDEASESKTVSYKFPRMRVIVEFILDETWEDYKTCSDEIIFTDLKETGFQGYSDVKLIKIEEK